MFGDPATDRIDPDDYHTADDDHDIDEDQAAHQPQRHENGEMTTEGVEEVLANLD